MTRPTAPGARPLPSPPARPALPAPFSSRPSSRCLAALAALAFGALAGCVTDGQVLASADAGPDTGSSPEAAAEDTGGPPANQDASPADCPSSEPSDGAGCASAGLVCNGYGTFSCPTTATCTAAGTWQVTCPAVPFGSDSGSCQCPHPIGAPTPDASANANACATAPKVVATSYDRSCTLDSDCVGAPTGGSGCEPCAFLCSTTALSAQGSALYQAASAALLAQYASENAMSVCVQGCQSFGQPCCRSGQCALGSACAAGSSNDAGAGD